MTDPNAIDSPQTVTVTVQVNGAPTSLDLYVTPSSGPSPTASVTVDTGSQVKSTVKTSDNGSWLSFALTGEGSYQFYTPYLLQATAQSNQSAGSTYNGTIALSGSSYSPDNQTINVNLHVTSQPILQISQLTYNLVQGGASQTVTVTPQNIGMGTLAISSASVSGLNGVSATASGGTSVTLTLNPGSLTPGNYTGTLTLSSNAANSSVPYPLRLNVTAAGNPLISVGGVVDNAAFLTGKAVGSGTIAAVFGSQFASGPNYASNVPLPTTLGGIQVLVNGTPAPLFYVDANQADFQVPFGLTAGQMVVQVTRNGQPGNQISAPVDTTAPRLFALQGLAAAPNTSYYGIVINSSDGTLALPSTLGVPAHPANIGDVVTIYALGLGPVSPSVATGAAAPASAPLAQLTVNPSQIQVVFGGGFTGEAVANPQYAGLAPNFVGLYQVNVAIPAGAPTGNVAVMISVPGYSSNSVEMAINAQTAAKK